MNKKTQKIIFIAIFLILIIIAGYRNYKKNNELDELGEETLCEIVEFEFVYKSSYKIIYKYTIKGKVYFGETDTAYFECDDGTKGCVGSTFRLIYSKENPKVYRIDLGKYEKYNKNRVQL